MNTASLLTTLITVIGVLVALVNIIVQVVKKVTWEKIPTSLLAVIVSLVLTLTAFFAYWSYASLPLRWYYAAAAVVVGLLVAYAAMFGFDKLKEILMSLGKIKDAQSKKGSV
jgi:uncharacterized protein YacL